MITEHFILAQNSSIDRDSNTLSVFQILEDLTVQSTGQTVTLPAQAVIVVKRQQETADVNETLRLKLLDPTGKTLFVQELPLKLQSNHRRARLRVGFPLTLTATGEYKVRLESEKYSGLNHECGFHANIVRQIPTPKQ